MKIRSVIILLTTLFVCCSTTNKKNEIFDELVNKERVVIYLKRYNLEAVPKEIGKLGAAKYLGVMKDSVGGWTVYPPLSALQEMADTPPFQQLPVEITSLTNLRSLELQGLDLKRLPEDFDKLQNLDSLDLSLNKLTISNELEKFKGT